MANSAQYAATPKNGFSQIITGDTSRTAPTNFGIVYTAGANGSRIDRINVCAIGTTIASELRMWICQGTVGVSIVSITFSGSTATVTTSSNHGLSTGSMVTVQGAIPSAYNVSGVSVSVTSLTTFTYTMGSSPTVNAVTVGYYSSTPSTAVFELWLPIEFTVVTPVTGTTAPYTTNISTAINPYQMPLFLQPGYSLRVSVNDTQTSSGLNVLAFGGDF